MEGNDWVPFCALEYFIMITKQKDNKESETKKTSEFPNIVRSQWWDGASPEHWVTTPHSSIPTPGILLCMVVGSQASCWAVDKDSDLELFCSWAHYLLLAFLLHLFSLSLSLLLSPLCLLITLESSFLLLPLRCEFATVQLSWSCYT